MEFEYFINQQQPLYPNEISGISNLLPPNQSDLKECRFI